MYSEIFRQRGRDSSLCGMGRRTHISRGRVALTLAAVLDRNCKL